MEPTTVKAVIDLIDEAKKADENDIYYATLFVTGMKYCSNNPDDQGAADLLKQIDAIISRKKKGTRQEVIDLTKQLYNHTIS